MQLTRANLVQLWSVWEIQLMVLLSFVVQLFLFFTGGLRRRKTNILLRVFIWLAYVGADLVAVYALGLLSRYEDRCNFEGVDPSVIIWAPFLLVHLGGQDTVTAFSIEDSNLWLRHLLNLVVQVILALYVFWNSIGQINLQLVAPATFIFVARIIKYGERTWALKCGSQEGLRSSSGYNDKQLAGQNNVDGSYASKASYALQTVLCARGLFAGRTLPLLEPEVRAKLFYGFEEQEKQVKNSIIQLELGMMYDILYTKAMVLQTWTGCIIRCVAHISMIVSFVLFIVTRKHGHSRVNVAITYTLFIGALIMEACAIATVILSPWTSGWAHLEKRKLLCWPPQNGMSSIFKAIRGEERSWQPNSMGQYNLADSLIRDRSTPTVISKMINAFGLDKPWRNLRHVKHVEAEKVIENFVDCIYGQAERITSRQLPLSKQLIRYIVRLPFEQAIIQLHLCTGIYVHRYRSLGSASSSGPEDGERIKALVEECEQLSNYMMYLLAVHPSMLPVNSTAAHEAVTTVSNGMKKINYKKGIKLEIMEGAFEECPWPDLEPFSRAYLEPFTRSDIDPFTRPDIDPFTRPDLKPLPRPDLEPLPRPDIDPFTRPYIKQLPRPDLEPLPRPDLEVLLVDIKDVWTRLLAYAAGKCRGELHARQLGDGGELITFVWLLMLHHGLGDASLTELKLSQSASELAAPGPPFYAFPSDSFDRD